MRRSPLSVAIAVAMGTVAVPAHGQQTPEEIVVTGSRIVQRDFVANSPIQTVDAELFENTSSLAVETVMNQLPQFVPAITQFTTADVQPSPTNTTGANTISLRGLGANRNLVLFDGRRAQPINALLVVDTNSIPSAAIERVEVVTGGASATYGADAIAGVVNFVMKKDFEGLSFDVQTGTTEHGDGEETRVAALFGANVDAGRGNVMLGVEYANREEAWQVGREFFDRRLADPTMPGTNTFSTNTTFTPTAGNLPNINVVRSIFGTPPVPVPNNGNAAGFLVNRTDGTLYSAGTNAAAGGQAWGAYRYADGFPDMRGTGQPQRKILTNGTVAENQPFSLVSTPLERHSIFGRGRYEVADGVEVYAQGNFVKSITRTIMQWSPASGAWNALIPYGDEIFAPSLCTAENSNIGCPGAGFTQIDHLPGGSKGVNCQPMGGCTNSQAFPVPPELARLLDSRPQRNQPWNLGRTQDYLVVPRSTANDSKLYQLMAGMQGAVDAIDGSWDVYISSGQTETQNEARGFGDLQQYRDIVGSANYGKGAVVLGPGTTVPFQGAGGTATCVSGIPIFGDFALSQDCLVALTASANDITQIDQNIFEGTVQGRIGELRAGEVRFAAGASYRENEIVYEIGSTNRRDSSVSQMIGLFSGNNVSGRTTASDVFGEVLLPLVSGSGFVETFSLELGARYSDYGGQGTADTYKSLFSLGFGPVIRLRGGWQRANRAPNVGELYSPENSNAQGTAYNGDPCGTASFAPWGANAQYNPNSQDTIALCRQLMGPAADIFYAEPQTTIFATVTVIERGNPNLHSETADTQTFGAVLSLENFDVAIDWYHIEIEDIIGAITYDTVYEQCISSQYNPSRTPTGNPYCAWIQRNPETGSHLRLDAARAHLGFYETAGVDVQFNWRKQLGGEAGTLALNVLTTFLDTYKIQDTPSSVITDIVGTNGPASQGGAAFDYRTFTTLNYSRGPFSTALRWRHYPSIRHTSARSDPNTTTEGSGKYDIFDLSGRYAFNERYEIRFGIDNLLDKEPLIHGRTPTASGNGLTLNQFYDVLGRRGYVGFTMEF
jgi:outer membrane receptor protein involved in Fe transport